MKTKARGAAPVPGEERAVPSPDALDGAARGGPAAAFLLDLTLAPAPGLAPGAFPLVPVFPLEDRGTGLVLYEGPPGGMSIHWRLERTDFERVAASFPPSGGAPAVVLRLRRDRPQGGSEQAQEMPLGLGVRDGSGERLVRMQTDHHLYHAELGLTNVHGGWLMLARSNGLYNAVGIGLDLRRLSKGGAEIGLGRGVTGGDVPALPETVSPAGPSGIRLPESPVEPALIEPASGEGWIEPALGEGADTALAPEFPLVPWASSQVSAPKAASAVPESAAVGRAQGPETPGGEGGGPAAAGSAQLGAGTEGTGPESGGGLAATLESAPTRIGVPLEPLTYERPPERVNGLELEAELRLTGRARPGSTIDLFGFRYRVGPGGRFQMLLPVTDPELLRRALEAAPPAELTRSRED
ncbi:MAG: hypothetical protein WAK53_01105 [Chromatiaceae bacterium]